MNGCETRWLRVRIVDKKDKSERVTINLPLNLARSVGGDVHLRDDLKLSEVLAQLQPGQDVVSIDDKDATIRVWVD